MDLVVRLFAVTALSMAAAFTIQHANAQYRASVGCSADKIDSLSEAASLEELECKCFNKCPLPTVSPPPSPQPPPSHSTHVLACEKGELIAWLDKHGVYGGQLDPSIYDDQIDWIVGGKRSLKQRSEIAKEEDDFRKVYPVQTYTTKTSSAAVVGGQCVLTQRVDVYKQRSNGKEVSGTFRIVFGIRTDANPPRVVQQYIDVLSGR
ncbi:hypothetical protein [Bradyrhizobium japonicum]|uniref:hypothetical protein n=1 Tax=Bradyrhizobium japonicum TaxID=375 RepID=UPI003B677ACE